MPRGNEYHQPNAPDALPDNADDSDLELDLNELGPSEYQDSTLDGQPRGPSRHESDNIPLRTLHSGYLRGPRTRGKRIQDAIEDENKDSRTTDTLQDGEDLSAGYTSVGDSTPLLQEDENGQTTEPNRSRGFAGRIGLSGLRSRRAGYRNLETETPTNKLDAGGKSAPRSINIGEFPPPRFPPNAISNAKYTPWSFLPRTLYNEFSFFINLYFLLVALSQVITPLQIGVLWTYMAPLVFVLTVTLGKEAYDDVVRRRRDAEANRELYTMLQLRDEAATRRSRKGKRGKSRSGVYLKDIDEGRTDAIGVEEERTGGSLATVDEVYVKSKDIKVGDVLKLKKNDRVPADVVILKSYTSESSAASKGSFASAEVNQQELLFEQHDNHEPKDSDLHSQDTNHKPSSAASADDAGNGETFIRTDQLDGETDWKLRLASPLTQSLHPRDFTRLTVIAGKPSKKVNEFLGRIELSIAATKAKVPLETQSPETTNPASAPLSIDNTAWANTVLASNATILAVVIYTGAQTRQALSTSTSRSKVGLLELEINNLTKILCALTLTLSGILVALQAYYHELNMPWYTSTCRFLVLFSSIIPISLRVNLDIGKTVYAYYIHHDKDMPEAVVRTSTIPEDLGRIEYLLSDKTGTLTQNEMDLRKVHVGTVSYANEAMEEVASYVKQGFATASSSDVTQPTYLVTPSSLLNASSATGTRTRREIGSRVRDVVLALALCHNVTPTNEEENGRSITAYQASSPDEIAIVRWTESVGLKLVHRDRQSIALQSVNSSRIVVRVKILEVFPFTSESKRMGIILQYFQGSESGTSRDLEPGEIWFYEKGADTVMTEIVAANDWLDEETANMAREGLRTLVVGRRKLSDPQYAEFSAAYREASMSFQSRDARMATVVKEYLEYNLELLGVTGVEDRLQRDVKPSLELLRNAGVKIWMLTGDKVETARCVAVSSKLVSRSQHVHTITSLEKAVQTNPTFVSDTLSLLAANPDSTALLIDGDSLSYLLLHHRQGFISLAVLLPAVIACRCSPTQKADVALLIRKHTKKRIACIGDGGNDVSMIQAADVGVGIVGKEGRQASLAADFSITQFHHLTKLLVWHGRNSYKRSAKLGQFIIHRGLVISIAQTVFSVAAHFQPDALFRDWLIIGYVTMYTQLPIFSLVLDRDVDENLANLYPELYKELKSGKSLSYRSFFLQVAIATYQGFAIQFLSQLLTGKVTEAPDPPSPQATEYADRTMAAVSFSVLVLNELLMAAMEVTTWHWIMGAAIVATFAMYAASVPFLGVYFDLEFVASWGFVWRFVAITAISVVPTYVGRMVKRCVRPPNYRKVRGV